MARGQQCRPTCSCASARTRLLPAFRRSVQHSSTASQPDVGAGEFLGYQVHSPLRQRAAIDVTTQVLVVGLDAFALTTAALAGPPGGTSRCETGTLRHVGALAGHARALGGDPLAGATGPVATSAHLRRARYGRGARYVAGHRRARPGGQHRDREPHPGWAPNIALLPAGRGRRRPRALRGRGARGRTAVSVAPRPARTEWDRAPGWDGQRSTSCSAAGLPAFAFGPGRGRGALPTRARSPRRRRHGRGRRDPRVVHQRRPPRGPPGALGLDRRRRRRRRAAGDRPSPGRRPAAGHGGGGRQRRSRRRRPHRDRQRLHRAQGIARLDPDRRSHAERARSSRSAPASPDHSTRRSDPGHGAHRSGRRVPLDVVGIGGGPDNTNDQFTNGAVVAVDDLSQIALTDPFRGAAIQFRSGVDEDATAVVAHDVELSQPTGPADLGSSRSSVACPRSSSWCWCSSCSRCSSTCS